MGLPSSFAQLYGTTFSSWRTPFVPLQRTFFLCIDRDRWLLIGDGGFYRRVDMLKLRVAVGIAGTLTRLPIGLTAVFQLAQQLTHEPLAGVEPLPGQCRDDVPLASADPTER